MKEESSQKQAQEITAEGNSVPSKEKKQRYFTSKRIAYTAMFTALNVVLCSFYIPTFAGELYFCDTLIYLASFLLDPISAMIAGGLGAFLGDLFFYPKAMWVSLPVHGLQALVTALLVHFLPFKKHEWISAIIAVIVGSVIMVVGYYLGKAFFYGNPATALASVPTNIAQTVMGAVLSVILCYACRLKSALKKNRLLLEK